MEILKYKTPIFLLQVLGSPTEETWPGISKSEELANYKFPTYAPEPMIARAPRLDPDGIDLISSFLLYEHRKRVSARTAIRHQYFRSLGPEIQRIADSEYLLHSIEVSTSPKIDYLISYSLPRLFTNLVPICAI